MSDEAENHSIPLLQEMRKEVQDMRDEMRGRFEAINLRIDVVSYIVTMLAGKMAGHDQRIEDLEAAIAKLSKD